MPGTDARRRVSVQPCKPFANHHDHGGMPKYLQAELTQYILNPFSKKSPPSHVTQNDGSTPRQPLEVEKITGYQSVCGRGGVIAVVYETHWTGISGPSWEWEMNPQLFRHEIFVLLSWHSESLPPNQPPVLPDASWCGETGSFS